MMISVKHHPRSLRYDTYRGVIISKSLELAVEAENITLPAPCRPSDVIHDCEDLRNGILNLAGRPECLIYNGLQDDVCSWTLALEEKLVKALPSMNVGLLMPNGTVIPRHGLMYFPQDEEVKSAEYKIQGAKGNVEFLRGSDIKPEAICWLWKDWLAKGKMHILGGSPGTGKTTIAIKLAATITNGGYWPDGERTLPGSVLIWSGEDDPADTLVPRLALAGADLSKVYFIGDIHSDDDKRSFDPAKDMKPLGRKLAEIGDIALVIVDPIVSAVAGDSHKNAETRRGLQPLVDLAAAHRFALLGITHFSKGTSGRDPTERITGSLAFGAMARVVMVAAKEESKNEEQMVRRLFLRAKSNIGADDGGYVYDLEQAELKDYPGVSSSKVIWGEAVSGNAREILAEAESQEGDNLASGSLNEAQGFLTTLLENNPLPAKQIKEEADQAGHSWATVRRAKTSLGIRSVKEGMNGWVWVFPCLKVLKFPEGAQQNCVSIFSPDEHLRYNDLQYVENDPLPHQPIYAVNGV